MERKELTNSKEAQEKIYSSFADKKITLTKEQAKEASDRALTVWSARQKATAGSKGDAAQLRMALGTEIKALRDQRDKGAGLNEAETAQLMQLQSVATQQFTLRQAGAPWVTDQNLFNMGSSLLGGGVAGNPFTSGQRPMPGGMGMQSQPMQQNQTTPNLGMQQPSQGFQYQPVQMTPAPDYSVKPPVAPAIGESDFERWLLAYLRRTQGYDYANQGSGDGGMGGGSDGSSDGPSGEA
jgi:hypothetical protein